MSGPSETAGDWPAPALRLKLLALGGLAWFAVLASVLLQHLPAPRSLERFSAGLVLVCVWFALFAWHSVRGHCIDTLARRALVIAQGLTILAAFALLENSIVPILLVVFAAQLPGSLGSRAGFALVTAATLALLAIALARMSFGDALTLTIAYFAFQAFSLLLSATLLQADRDHAEVASINTQLLATQALLKESVRDRERLRIARELHDLIGHKLTALQLNLQAAVRGTAPVASEIITARDIAAQILNDIRNVVAYVPRQAGTPLNAALAELAGSFPGSMVHVAVSPEAHIEDLDIAQSLLRCVQEATSNAIRHGQASEIRIDVTRENETIVLTIRDDGAGVRGAAPGFGLSSIRARMAAIGGTVALAELQPRGTQVQIVVPAPSS